MYPVHLFSGDNNLGPFHIRLGEIAVKHEKVRKYFVLKIFLLLFTALKMHWNSKKWSVFSEENNVLYKYSFAAIWSVCSTKLVLDTKVQNSVGLFATQLL